MKGKFQIINNKIYSNFKCLLTSRLYINQEMKCPKIVQMNGKIKMEASSVFQVIKMDKIK